MRRGQCTSTTAEEQTGGENLWDPGATELPSDLRPPAVEENTETDKGEDGEECDGEGQRSWVDLELLALGVVVDGSDGPGHADPQEDVDCVASCHIANGGVGILVLDG